MLPWHCLPRVSSSSHRVPRWPRQIGVHVEALRDHAVVGVLPGDDALVHQVPESRQSRPSPRPAWRSRGSCPQARSRPSSARPARRPARRCPISGRSRPGRRRLPPRILPLGIHAPARARGHDVVVAREVQHRAGRPRPEPSDHAGTGQAPAMGGQSRAAGLTAPRLSRTVETRPLPWSCRSRPRTRGSSVPGGFRWGCERCAGETRPSPRRGSRPPAVIAAASDLLTGRMLSPAAGPALLAHFPLQDTCGKRGRRSQPLRPARRSRRTRRPGAGYAAVRVRSRGRGSSSRR